MRLKKETKNGSTSLLNFASPVYRKNVINEVAKNANAIELGKSSIIHQKPNVFEAPMGDVRNIDYEHSCFLIKFSLSCIFNMLSNVISVKK